MAEKDPLSSMLPLSRVFEPTDDDGVVSSGVDAVQREPGKGATSVFLVDAHRRIRFASEGCRSLFDDAERDFVGEPLSGALSLERFEAARRTLGSISGGVSYRDVASLEGVDVQLRVDLERAELGGEEYFLLGLHDRSARGRERFELSELGREMVGDSEPPSARVHQAQHFEVLGLLTGTLAHDFSNLLSVILGSLESARRKLDRGLDPSVELERARIAAERSVQTTNDVLHYSRRRERAIPEVEPTRVLDELRGLLARALDDVGTLEIETRPCPPVRVEVAQLETALLNLVVNARDAITSGGHVRVACASRQVEASEASALGIVPGKYVVFSVEDDGQGMTDEVREKAFEPFFTTKPEGAGTGLGLSTVRGLARKAGGTATIRSAPGAGTTVAFLLPAVPDR